MIARIRKTLAVRRTRWESLCRRCGRCCYEKERRGGVLVANYRKPCPHLDTGTHACRVYAARFEVCTRCRKMTIVHALFVQWLPETCGYVVRFGLWAGRKGK
jgi:uncharacterized cysteine cluster protein YcgN (CxxCxxCC family)